MLFLLAVTLGVFFLAYAAAKYLPARMARTGKATRLKVLERVVVGKDRQIAIVRAGSQFFLVGIAGQSVQIGPALDSSEFLSETADVPIDATAGGAGPATAILPTFADMLRKAGFPLPGNGKDSRK